MPLPEKELQPAALEAFLWMLSICMAATSPCMIL
jgi:hypothetical protein